MTQNRNHPTTLDPEVMWNALVAHDRRYDGAFVCAVSSTGVYCRPTCPAKRPHRSRVQFYGSPEEARGAGYRACLRCHPDRPETDADLVAAACSIIDQHIEEYEALPTVTDVCNAHARQTHVALSASRLHRLFKLETGLTPSQYARGRRMERFKALVKDGDSVAEALYDSGFGSSSRLYESASGQMGMTPATYRKGGAGAKICYVVTGSALGGLLVAATGSGICAVKLGDDTEGLIAELQQEFPAATLTSVPPGDGTPEDSGLRHWVATLHEYLAGRRTDIDLPLDVLATVFQWRVWRRLQAIPLGDTRTYQEMAADLEKPTASRAVGRACATNPVAPIIPCHRAVRKDGGLAGYRWGLHRKEALLEMEQRLKADQDQS